ncbi:hypothetical protein Taro_053837, partial [Colocasia esculenta]|nr:hypothetical protein [Colocasia esculenta]
IPFHPRVASPPARFPFPCICSWVFVVFGIHLVCKMRSFIPLRERVTLVAAVLLCFLIGGGRCVRPSPAGDGSNLQKAAPDHVLHKEGEDDDLNLSGMFATGSSLPDCSHACGPCAPCRRVMVSFECSVAESCPIVYRCMCRGRYYQVPSN